MSRTWWILPIIVLTISGCMEENPGSAENAGGDGVDPSLLVALSDLYEQMPVLSACNPGVVRASEQQEAIAYINEVRALHDLPPVTHNPAHDEHTRRAALIIVANDHLSHNPPDDLLCWSPEGALGSQKSNLAWAARLDDQPQKGFTTEYMIDSWWKDSAVDLVGHRRWLLDPFLQNVSFGRADRPGSATTFSATGAALWVIDEDRPAPIGPLPDFVAYPFEHYPADLFNAGLSMSFSAVVDRENYWANQGADLTEATVTITDPSGNPLQVRNLTRTNDAFGVPNCLTWEADVQKGVRYEVTVEGIEYNGEEKGYSYWFRIE